MDIPASNLVEVSVHRLDVGMYVAELDRPWLETPFAVQGFYIRSSADVDSLAEYCQYVYVDPRRYVPGQRLAPRAKVRRRGTYADSTPMREEFDTASEELGSAQATVNSVFERIRGGGPLDIGAMSRAVQPLVDSVLRNQNALAALLRIRKKDNYTYGHSLAVAVWSSVLGRQLGLAKDVLARLALGASLIDVGKARIGDELLKKVGSLSLEELLALRGHLGHSIDIVQAAGVEPEVLETVRHHHERHDGSGYSEGLAGSAIPLSARIAGIADAYDAMITERPYAPARSSFQAMQELADLKNAAFQGELVEQFMQAIGLFPTGSLVELNSAEVGIVIAQNTTRRLKPKVMLVLDADKRRIAQFRVVDLAAGEAVENGMWISKELAPGSFGVDAEEFYL